MSKINIMTKSGKKGIILATVMLFSVFLLLIPTSAHAEEITVKSIGIDETTIITLTNEVPIETISKMLGHNNIKTTQL